MAGFTNEVLNPLTEDEAKEAMIYLYFYAGLPGSAAIVPALSKADQGANGQKAGIMGVSSEADFRAA